jgi:hypothetical protein
MKARALGARASSRANSSNNSVATFECQLAEYNLRQLRIEPAAALASDGEIHRPESVGERKFQHLPVYYWPQGFRQIINKWNRSPGPAMGKSYRWVRRFRLCLVVADTYRTPRWTRDAHHVGHNLCLCGARVDFLGRISLASSRRVHKARARPRRWQGLSLSRSLRSATRRRARPLLDGAGDCKGEKKR